jgi:hypothetical protein
MVIANSVQRGSLVIRARTAAPQATLWLVGLERRLSSQERAKSR